MGVFPKWLADLYETLDNLVSRYAATEALRSNILDKLKDRLTQKAAAGKLPEDASEGRALITTILKDAITDCLRRSHLVAVDLPGDFVDTHVGPDPLAEQAPSDWEICEADLFPWARARSDLDLPPGVTRLLELPDGISDAEAAARLGLPIKAYARARCRVLLRLAKRRRRLESSASAVTQPA